MNFIIFLSPKSTFSDFLLLNIIERSLLVKREDKNVLTLVCWNDELIDNIYFKKKSFKTIFNIIDFRTFIKSIISINKNESKKVIINISGSKRIRIYSVLFLRKIIKKIRIPKSTSQLEKKVKLLQNKLGKIDKLSYTILKKPAEKINITEIENTSEYIDWTLKSSGLRALSHIRYIHIILKSKNLSQFKQIISTTSKLVNGRNNLYLILTLSEKRNSEIKKLMNYFIPETRNKIIGKEIRNYDDNLIINLIQKSKFIITNDEVYSYYCKSKEKECIYISKIKNGTTSYTKTQEQEFENKIKYALKNTFRT